MLERIVGIPPTSLYKHVDKADHVEATRTAGVVCVSTLARYRALLAPYGDRLEGSKEASFVVPETTTFKSEDVTRVMAPNTMIRRVGGGSVPITIGAGATVKTGWSVGQDVYLFCASALSAIGHFGAHRYAITDVSKFGRAVGEALQATGVPVEAWTLAAVRYEDSQEIRIESPAQLQGVPPDFMGVAHWRDYYTKPLAFQGEAEWRFVFWTLSDPPEPFRVLNCDLSLISASCRFP